jgi:hypothetical protein
LRERKKDEEIEGRKIKMREKESGRTQQRTKREGNDKLKEIKNTRRKGTTQAHGHLNTTSLECSLRI